ncbi:MAG: pirin family protein [Planctomycetota bacterium]
MTTKHIDVRSAHARGQTDLGWLQSRHSFSFGGYQDPSRMGYRSLRVINDDRVAPGGGFGEHGHRDMEIISWVLDGALQHRDSTGTRGEIVPGDVQVMSAGSGIRHSEMNASSTEPVHFLQIWIEPARTGLKPQYAQRSFDPAGRRNAWQLVVSPDGRLNSIHVQQDANLSIAELQSGQSLPVTLDDHRHGYLHVATGEVDIDGVHLLAGDAVTFADQTSASIAAHAESQILLFDLG